jgi:hypothetical protein
MKSSATRAGGCAVRRSPAGHRVAVPRPGLSLGHRSAVCLCRGRRGRPPSALCASAVTVELSDEAGRVLRAAAWYAPVLRALCRAGVCRGRWHRTGSSLEGSCRRRQYRRRGRGGAAAAKPTRSRGAGGGNVRGCGAWAGAGTAHASCRASLGRSVVRVVRVCAAGEVGSAGWAHAAGSAVSVAWARRLRKLPNMPR